MQSQNWRFIPPIQATGTLQMAVDRWLFEQHLRGHIGPVLRFYTWNPAAISLGYHQRQYPPHWEQLTWAGHAIALVRRPTGGRAVLHQGDLTYAVILSGLPANRMQSYQYICEFLIQGWRSLGIELFYGQTKRGYIHNPNCFGTATAADLITGDGAKLIGSAQLRRGNTILQHGSIRLDQDAALFQQVFGVNPMLPQLPFAADTAHISKVMEALFTAAQTHFGATFQIQPLAPEEWQQIRQQDYR